MLVCGRREIRRKEMQIPVQICMQINADIDTGTGTGTCTGTDTQTGGQHTDVPILRQNPLPHFFTRHVRGFQLYCTAALKSTDQASSHDDHHEMLHSNSSGN